MRTLHGLVQSKFAESVGMSGSYLLEIEKGRAKPGFDFFFNLVEKYNVNLNYLFYGPLLWLGERFEMDDNDKEFLRFYFGSPFFRFRILSAKHQLMQSEKETILKDMEE